MTENDIKTRKCKGKLLFLWAFLVVFQGNAQKEIYFPQPDFKQISKQHSYTYADSMQLKVHFQKIQLLAIKKGYLTFSIDSVETIDSTHSQVYVSLGEKYKQLTLLLGDNERKALRSIGISPKTIETTAPTPQAIGQQLDAILSEFENHGFPFAKLSFSSLSQEGNRLVAELAIAPGPEIRWQEINITGEKVKLSPKYMHNFLHIEPGDIYNQQQVELINARLKQLLFVRQTKPAEILFTPAGANLYLYLETKPVSSFNGTVGLQQDPIKQKYYLTGDLRLKLQNAFRHGELFDLNWRSIQAGSPQLKILANYPFLFNTAFGLEGQFSLFKRDSSFLELKTGVGVSYFLSAGRSLTAFYKNEQSNLLSGGVNINSFGTTKNNSYGLNLRSQTVDYLPNPRRGFIWFAEAQIGNRKLTKDTITSKFLVYAGKVQLVYYQPLGKRFVIKLATQAETFYSDNIQQNELLRFGGNLLQRGFLEDELLATFRSTITVEPRFILDQNSYLFAFHDQSWYERNVANYLNDQPFGFGAGLSFGTTIGIFSLTYAVGKQFNNPILFRDSKIHFGYVAYF